MDKIITHIKIKAIPILKRHKVVKAGIFGSYARGKQKNKSDIDLLIEIKEKGISLLDIIRLEQELEKYLKKKIDIVEYREIHPLLKKKILKEEVRIYG